MIKEFKRRKVYTRFKDNNWTANLAEMGSFSSKNKKCYIFVFNEIFSQNMRGLNLYLG